MTGSVPMPRSEALRRIPAADLAPGAAFWVPDAFVAYRSDSAGRIAFMGVHNHGRRYTVKSTHRRAEGLEVLVSDAAGAERSELAPDGAHALVEVAP